MLVRIPSLTYVFSSLYVKIMQYISKPDPAHFCHMAGLATKIISQSQGGSGLGQMKCQQSRVWVSQTINPNVTRPIAIPTWVWYWPMGRAYGPCAGSRTPSESTFYGNCSYDAALVTHLNHCQIIGRPWNKALWYPSSFCIRWYPRPVATRWGPTLSHKWAYNKPDWPAKKSKGVWKK